MSKSSIASFALLAVVLAPLSGCSYYFGDDDDDDDCDYGGDAPIYEPDYLRNPESGQCEYFGGGGGGCDYTCGPCAEPAGAEDGAAYYPSWAFCDSYCETLDETTCLATSGCRGVYVDDGLPSFWQCWGTDQTGPISGGGCAGLDAYSCSLHDDCIAVHSYDAGCGGEADPAPGGGAPEPCSGIGWFEYCADETAGCYSDAECGEGMRCNAAEVCLPAPGCTDSGDGLIDCDAACYGYCVPDDVPDPGACTGDVFCDSLPPACPLGTMPGIKDGCWTGYCIPLSQCEGVGTCTGDVLCDMVEPVCPEGSTPGILAGCYSGYCIPLSACEDPPPPIPCNEIGNESQCIDRADCSAFYEGVDCVCDELGNCECADWVFVECQ